VDDEQRAQEPEGGLMKTNYFDHYSFRARLQPAFLALVPIAVGVMAWAQPGARWVTALWSLLGAAGFTFFLANVARNRGKSIEPKLWASWGGAPTTLLLRHRGEANPVLRERWHQQLAKLVGRPMPTAAEESEDPAAADALYEAGTKLLIGKTYDTKAHPFVYRDNVNYGFCRNLYGLRGLGIAASLLGAAVSVGAGFWFLVHGKAQLLPWASAATCVAMLLWWIFTVTASWVKLPAMNYAQHLFAAAEKLPKTKKQ
jgi:hypothetical protein